MNLCPPRYTPYLSNNLTRRRPTKTQEPQRAKSSIGSRNQTRQGRCTTQASPDRIVINNCFTQVANKSSDLKIQVIDQQETPFLQIFQSTQIKRSPSFRLKNYKEPEIVRQTKRPSIHSITSNQDRINRINVLGNLIEQIENDNAKPGFYKLLGTTDLATVPKQSTQSQDNLEELHFILVQSHQRTKQLALSLEEKF